MKTLTSYLVAHAAHLMIATVAIAAALCGLLPDPASAQDALAHPAGVFMALTVSAPFTVTPVLTAIAVAYRNAQMIADRVLPRVRVGSQAFKYRMYPKGTFFSVPETEVGRKGAPKQVEFESSEQDSSCVDQGLDSPVPNADEELARSQNLPSPQGRAAEITSDLILLRREIRTANLVFDADTYGADNKLALAGADRWDDPASDPIGDITAALEDAILPYNVLVLGSKTSLALRKNPKIVKAYHGTEGADGLVPLEFIRELFELEDIVVGVGRVNAAKKGQAVDLQRVWGNHAALIHRDLKADTQDGTTFGVTAQWGGRIGGTIQDPDIGVRGGVRVRVAESVKELVLANDLGFFFENAVS